MTTPAPITVASLAVNAAGLAGRLEAFVFALRVGANDPQRLVNAIEEAAQQLAALADRAVAPAPPASAFSTGGQP